MGKPYRACVVGVFVDDNGLVLVAERSDYPGSWQLPQGGVDDGEILEKAIKREMLEELGVVRIQILAKTKDPILYEFPPDIKAPVAKKFRGQSMTWFRLKLEPGETPDLTKACDKEFTSFKWVSWQQAINGITPWKKAAYTEGFRSLGFE